MAKQTELLITLHEMCQTFHINDFDIKNSKTIIKKFVLIVKKEVNDPRYENMCDYAIETIIVTAFLAILCDRLNWGQIADYTKDNKKWLEKFVPFKNKKTPIDDTYRRVFSLIDSTEFNKACSSFVKSLFEKIKKVIEKYLKGKNREDIVKKGYAIYNIDGKVGNGTGRFYNDKEKKIKNQEILNIFNVHDGITLFSIPIADKTNEIPVAQETIKLMNLKDTIITADAIHAQHKTFETILKQRGDYCIVIKGNQGDAFEEINLSDSLFDENKQKDDNYLFEVIQGKCEKEFIKVPFSKFRIEKGYTDDGVEKWIGSRNIVKFIKKNLKTNEIKNLYFITSLNDIETIKHSITLRWEVENNLHRPLDMFFDEDDNKTMDKYAFNNLSILKKLAISLIRISQPLFNNRSVIRIKKSLAGNPLTYLTAILYLSDSKKLESIFTA